MCAEYVKLSKLVIFDLGNTLIHYHRGPLSDQEKDYLGLLNMSQRLKRWGLDVSLTDLSEAFYKPWIRKMRYRKQKKTEYPVSDFLSTAVPLEQLDVRQFKRLMLDFFEPTLRFSEAGKYAAESLKRLSQQGFKLAVVSNSPIPGYCHDQALAKHGLLELMDFTLYSYDLRIRKPAPEIFLQALFKADCQPGLACMVGDSQHLDITPASALGLHTIHYSEKSSAEVDARDFQQVGKAVLEYFKTAF